MLVPNQIVELTMSGTYSTHFKSLGYRFKYKDKIKVPVEDLPNSSHLKINVICDYCGKIFKKEYRHFINSQVKSDCCKECKGKKIKQTCIIKYGVENVFQLEEVKKKSIETCLLKYDTKYASSSKEFRDMVKDTCIKKYGVENVAQLEDVKEKKKNTNIAKYGVEYPASLKEIRNKVRLTMISRYGFAHALQIPEIKDRIKSNSDLIKKKRNETLCKNGTCKTSSQQIELHKMIQEKYPNAILNYPFDRCIFDIALILEEKDIKIDIEYDGWYWHQDKQKDRRRNYYNINKGWKVLRVKSGCKLPSEKGLFEAIDYLINTEHHYKEIILDDWKDVAI